MEEARMYKIFYKNNDSIFIELKTITKYIQNYIEGSNYKYKNISIDSFLNENDNNEMYIYINESLNEEIIGEIDSLRKEILFILSSELNINDFYVNIILR
ncbi:MAG: hypothetical protein ACRC8C_00595 [Mycoplasmoidaceae bacterium]